MKTRKTYNFFTKFLNIIRLGLIGYLFLLALPIQAQDCCDIDDLLDLCYLSGADYCGFGGGCPAYSLDGDFMVDALVLKLTSPDNFGPNGTVNCEFNLKKLEDVSSVQAINDCNCDVVFLPSVFSDPVTNNIDLTESYIPQPILQNVYDWSLECENNLVIATQAEANLWGYTTENANVNPNTPIPGTSFNSIFDGPFGSVDFFEQGGSYQGVFTGTPSTGFGFLAQDAIGNPTVAIDEVSNDIVLGDIGIFLSGGAGAVSSGPNVNNNNDILVCNLFALACSLAEQEVRTRISQELCVGESAILPGGQIVNEAGFYIDTLTSFNGCDSIITTSVAYGVESASIFQNFDSLLVCTNDTIIIDGTFRNYPDPFYEISLAQTIEPFFTNVISEVLVTGFGSLVLSPDIVQSVCVNIAHDNLEDLVLLLIAPDGSVLELSSENGGAGDDYTNTCFTEIANNTIGTGASIPPFVGNWLPEGDWSNIYGGSVDGIWQLVLRDENDNNIVGTLLDWSITFAPALEFTYQWETSVGLSCTDCPITNAFPSVPTLYYLTTTDIFGCVSLDSVNISLIEILLPAPVAFCVSASSSSMMITWDSIPGAYGYEVNINNTGWIDPNSGDLAHQLTSLTPMETVTISIRGYDECKGEVTTITCNTLPCTAPEIVIDVVSGVSCFGSNDGSINLTATGNNGIDFTYELNGSINTTGDFSSLPSGDYEVLFTDQLGCSNNATVTIPSPDALSLVPVVVEEISCEGEEDGSLAVAILGGVGPYQFNWDGMSTDSILSGLGQGDYDLLVTDANGCSTNSTLIINEPLVSFTVDFVASPPLCFGESTGEIDLIINPENDLVTYSWSGSNNLQSSEQDLVGISVGNYAVVITDERGCTTTTLVEIGEPEALLIDINSTDVSCFGLEDGSVNIEGSGGQTPYLYSIDGGSSFVTSGSIGNLSAGVYNLKVQDMMGCEDSLVVTIDEPRQIFLILDSLTEIRLGESYTLDAFISIPNEMISSIIWTPDDNTNCVDNCLSLEVSPLQDTEYTLQVINENGCVSETFTTILVDSEVSIYIPNAFSPNFDGTNDVFMIFAEEPGIRRVKSFNVFNRWGALVYGAADFSPNDPANSWDGTFKGEIMKPDVFVWYAEIERLDGVIEFFQGDVTLLQ